MNNDSHFSCEKQSHKNSQLPINENTNELTGITNMKKRDCFELLSAYLDGEVTSDERRQVEEWLSTDKAIRAAYKRQLNIRQGLRNMPIPASEHSLETIIERVFTRINRPYQLGWMLSGAAIAAYVCGTISGLLPTSKMFEIAQNNPIPVESSNTKVTVINSPPMVALNNPVIEIPKAAIAPHRKSENKLN